MEKFTFFGPSWKKLYFWIRVEKINIFVRVKKNTCFCQSWKNLHFLSELEKFTFLVSLFSWQGVQEWGAGGPFQVTSEATQTLPSSLIQLLVVLVVEIQVRVPIHVTTDQIKHLRNTFSCDKAVYLQLLYIDSNSSVFVYKCL